MVVTTGVVDVVVVVQAVHVDDTSDVVVGTSYEDGGGASEDT